MISSRMERKQNNVYIGISFDHWESHWLATVGSQKGLNCFSYWCIMSDSQFIKKSNDQFWNIFYHRFVCDSVSKIRLYITILSKLKMNLIDSNHKYNMVCYI